MNSCNLAMDQWKGFWDFWIAILPTAEWRKYSTDAGRVGPVDQPDHHILPNNR